MKTLEERFWSKVRKTSDCWWWEGGASNRYGNFCVFKGGKDRSRRAHVVSFFLAVGRWPRSGMDVMHSCDNRLCVNPEHLSEGTRKQNIHDAISKGILDLFTNSRKTHCSHGHEFTVENTRWVRRGRKHRSSFWSTRKWRQCRECVRINQSRYRLAKKLGGPLSENH